MFTQFFGNYLLNERLCTPAQLIDGLQEKKNTRVKLGVLAINAGYMTSEQVDKIHEMQTKLDKRIGDIAVEFGYMTQEQTDELLNSQKPGYLLLGQTLVDKGYLTNAEFEKAIHAYKQKYSLSDDDIVGAESSKIEDMIKTLYDFTSISNGDLYASYISLLVNNLVRFIGDDFTPLKPLDVVEADAAAYRITQNITGTFSTCTSVIADEKTLVDFSSRYAEDEMNDLDEYAQAAVCDFVNLHNGLFTVNVSNDQEIELRLTPPEFEKGVSDNKESVFVLPIQYPFGTLHFVITL